MADLLSFDAYLEWKDVLEGDNIPPDAKRVMAADLLRYEMLGLDVVARINEYEVKWDTAAETETYVRNSLTTNANQITGVQNKLDSYKAEIAARPGGITTSVTLPAGADLNNYRTAGIYSVIGANATKELNFPRNGLAGTIVIFYRTGEIVNQVFYPISVGQNGGGLYTRSYVSTTWGPWFFQPNQRVDTTGGITIYTWDDANGREQVIYRSTDARVHVGTTAPADTSMVWVDIS
jgi:hypothetical protein